MALEVPAVLQSLSSAGSAISALTTWRKKARGDARALVGELKDNLYYLDMVAEDGVELAAVVDKLSITEYKRLSREGYNFNALEKKKIAGYDSLRGTDLASWSGKSTENLIESICEKLNILKIKFPHVAQNSKYRWSVRVDNIRKRIWLLLRHAGHTVS
ncbi:MAG: hypothetical protein BMS9Abin01_0186 [Gammaproteobacteria bacterium]|nr:MAG: hypothetical protein BMS9Abin01_0186 [Gammaproteobacteria bacterium]